MSGKRVTKNCRKMLSIFTVILSFFLVACGTNGVSQKALDEGKVAIVSKEYEKARDLFKLAVDEDNKNSEAKELLDLSNNYIELMEIMTTNEFDKADELIAKIENNKKLEIIKADFEKTKNAINEYKEIISKYSNEIGDIEKLLENGDIDEAKLQATLKLQGVVGYKVLEDKLNNVINKVNETIENAKNEINQYHLGEEIIYIGLKDSSFNGYDKIEKLKGKNLLYFKENHQYGSPKEYMYDIEDGNIYRLDQGRYLCVNNNNEVIYEIKDPGTKNTEQTLEIKISSEESRKIALEYFLSKRPDMSSDEVLVAMGDEVNENNEYYRGICGYEDDAKTIPGKVIAEYYVNATTGVVRVLWD